MSLTGNLLKYILVFAVGGCSFYIICIASSILLKRDYFKEEPLNDFSLWEIRRCVLVALFGGICAFLSFLSYSSVTAIITVFLFISILILIAVVDQATMEIPNTFVLAAFILGIISIFTMPGISLLSRVLGMFVVSVPLLLLTLLIPGAFGGGDIKLMAACGLFLGTKLILLSFAFAVLTGGLYGIWLLVMKKKSGKEHFAFGPFLCVGMAAALFIGDRVWNWYLSLMYL